MRMARKLGVITYRSALEWDGRFGRVRPGFGPPRRRRPFGLEFEVESYLEGHARRFVRRFDPNCYLYLSRSMDWFDLAEIRRRPWTPAWAGSAWTRVGHRRGDRHPVPPAAAGTGGAGPARRGCQAEFLPLPSPQGHDAFLVDIARFRAGGSQFPFEPLSRIPVRHVPSRFQAPPMNAQAAPASCHDVDFQGRDKLVAAIDMAVAAGDEHAVTAALRNALCKLIKDHDVQLPACVHDPIQDHYARRELYRSPEHGYSVVAMTWGPGQGTPVHDHSGLWCVEGVWDGELEIVQYELLERDGERFRFRAAGGMHAAPAAPAA
jgi:hypothetical protein